jgi:hypothetical protein
MSVDVKEVHEAYLSVARSMLEKIKARHPGQNPQQVLDGAMQSFGTVLAGLGDLSPQESFLVLGFIATIPTAAILRHKGPAEVAPFVKSMAELFAYTMLDRIPQVIDQMVRQDAVVAMKRSAKVTLS